jgi:predicted homoserine dehydrogenase-like protein
VNKNDKKVSKKNANILRAHFQKQYQKCECAYAIQSAKFLLTNCIEIAIKCTLVEIGTRAR